MAEELVIVHYHLRPSGVRRVIELATPEIASRIGCRRVILVAGEKPPDNWIEIIKSKIKGKKLELFIRPSFGYISEQSCSISELKIAISKDISDLFCKQALKEPIIWFHNPAVGRNILLTDEIFQKSAELQMPLIAHHHDWWFENRWQRMDEMSQGGFDSLEKIARVYFNPSPNIKHCAINCFDYSLLKKHFPDNSAWLPNPIESDLSLDETSIQNAREWLTDVLGDKSQAWMMPCRFLRRKNIAEAILLKEWLTPKAWLCITAKASSADETHYADAISEFCKERKIKFKSGLLANHFYKKQPDVYSLIAASNGVFLTSLQEGFGLPYIEAGLIRVPLIARMLPSLKDDFEQLGLRFPYAYSDILIHPELFSWQEESHRQRQIYHSWLEKLPQEIREWVKLPEIAKNPLNPEPMPFSRLTLQAQFEVLSHPTHYSFEKCASLNPFISKLKNLADNDAFKPMELSPQTFEMLSVKKYAENFSSIINIKNHNVVDEQTPIRAQNEFIKKKLSSEFIYPLLIEKPGE